MRLKPLVSPHFRLNYTPTGAIAPGLEVIAEIEFQLPDDGTLEDVPVEGFRDVLHVMTNDHVIDVPLRAIRPVPELHFGDHLDFGLVVLNTKVILNCSLCKQRAAPSCVLCAGSVRRTRSRWRSRRRRGSRLAVRFARRSRSRRSRGRRRRRATPQMTKEFTVANVGTAPGTYSITHDPALPLAVAPADGRLGAGAAPVGLEEGEDANAGLDPADVGLPSQARVASG